MRVFFSLFLALCSLSTTLGNFATADDASFRDALAELRSGHFIVADKLFLQLSKAQRDVDAIPDFNFFSAQAAFGNGYYKRAKASVDKYLMGDPKSLLYLKEAEALKQSVAAAIVANASSDITAFEYAQKQGTIFGYATYSRLYPEGQNVMAADFLAFQRAKQINTEIAYLRYLEFWPDGQYVTDAKRSVDFAAFKEARRQNTIQSYQIYIKGYPQGHFQQQAEQREEVLAFSKANHDGSVAVIKLFLAQHPKGFKRTEAEKSLSFAIENAPLRDLIGPTVKIPAGAYIYRKPSAQNRFKIISISKAFTAMAYEVTFNQWDRCLEDRGCNGYRPGDMKWGRGQRPVINVNRQDIEHFVGWINGRWTDAGGKGLWRLPSETEWAYMARGTINNINIQGDGLTQASAACQECEDLPELGATFPVGLFKQNRFGLFDILGNVNEWAADCWHEDLTENDEGGGAWIGDGECISGVTRGSTDLSMPVFFALRARQETGLTSRSSTVGFRLVRSR